MVTYYEMLNEYHENNDTGYQLDQQGRHTTFGSYAKALYNQSNFKKQLDTSEQKANREKNIKLFANQMKNNYFSFIKNKQPSESIINELFTPKGVSVETIKQFLTQEEFNNDEQEKILHGITDANVSSQLNNIFMNVSKTAYNTGRVKDTPSSSVQPNQRNQPSQREKTSIKPEILQKLNIPSQIRYIKYGNILNNKIPNIPKLIDYARLGNYLLNDHNLSEITRQAKENAIRNAKLEKVSATNIRNKLHAVSNNNIGSDLGIFNNLALIGNAFLGLKV